MSEYKLRMHFARPLANGESSIEIWYDGQAGRDHVRSTCRREMHEWARSQPTHVEILHPSAFGWLIMETVVQGDSA